MEHYSDQELQQHHEILFQFYQYCARCGLRGPLEAVWVTYCMLDQEIVRRNTP